MAATVPVRTTLFVPLALMPVEVRPLVTLFRTVIVPWITPRATVTLAESASTSAMLRPVMDRLVSSFTVWAVGPVLTGASFTLVTVTVSALV